MQKQEARARGSYRRNAGTSSDRDRLMPASQWYAPRDDVPVPRAVLGPTNTGKTWYAIERLLAHEAGVIGFPLRLLARENYDRVAARAGIEQTALITGEERIVPPDARYYLCTIEAMPPRLTQGALPFLALDEIQLFANRERGHIFTDRLLYARGSQETLFLGSDTARRLVGALVPGTVFLSRPRLSRLSHLGPLALAQLPARSAVICFSMGDVYLLADRIRQRKGGAAIVSGALSPHTRNAQVALYQNGEVDYLVATDAIGMGLNLDLRHIAFASLRKFDGQDWRRLSAAEIAQIAGRAGRHQSNGSFGALAGQEVLDPDTIARIETHELARLQHAYWRNAQLCFSSPEDLLASLEKPASRPELLVQENGADHRALMTLLGDREIADLAKNQSRLHLLWQVCCIPDFLRDAPGELLALRRSVYLSLLAHDGKLPEDWLERAFARLERYENGIAALTQRLCAIRTMNYVVQRGAWVDPGTCWRERGRLLEEQVSSTLHEQLTLRFIDRRAPAFALRGPGKGDRLSSVDREGIVRIEGVFAGHMKGFRFVPEGPARAGGTGSMEAEARRAVLREIPRRLRDLRRGGDDQFELSPAGEVFWRGAAVARLVAGPHPLRPALAPPCGEDLLDLAARRLIHERITPWLHARIAHDLAIWVQIDANLRAKTGLSGPLRGILYRIDEAWGLLDRNEAEELLREMNQDDLRLLARYGVRVGTAFLWFEDKRQAGPVALYGSLWAIAHHCPVPVSLCPRHRSVPVQGRDAGFCRASGYVALGPRAVRVDQADRLIARLRGAFAAGQVILASDALGRMVGVRGGRLAPILNGLGFHVGARGVIGEGSSRPPGAASRQISGRNKAVVPREDARRLDNWLFHARLFHARAEVARLCRARLLRVDGKIVAKAHFLVRQGMVLTFPCGNVVRVVRVRGLAVRRGPACQAVALYEDVATG